MFLCDILIISFALWLNGYLQISEEALGCASDEKAMQKFERWKRLEVEKLSKKKTVERMKHTTGESDLFLQENAPYLFVLYLK